MDFDKENLQREVNKLDCKTAEMALKRLGGEGRGEYFFLYNFINHVERLQTKEKEAALFKPPALKGA